MSSEDFYHQADRFLNIVRQISEKDSPEIGVPVISFNDNGTVCFSPSLMKELMKSENEGLLEWAILHAKDLF